MRNVDHYMVLPYSIRVHRNGSRGNSLYVASVVELDGCMAQGRTEQEARAELRAAQRLYIETMIENGVPVPDPAPLAARR